jgi:ornithine carbamoyltransferase
MGAIMGAHVVAATPSGKWAPHAAVVETAKKIAALSGGKVEVVHDPESASKDASVLYTDVWMSMGDSESERDEKVLALSPFAVTENLMRMTNKDSLFMHCLPAHRGEEVEASVIDGPRSVIWREAYHRRTTIQALLFHLTNGDLKGSKH